MGVLTRVGDEVLVDGHSYVGCREDDLANLSDTEADFEWKGSDRFEECRVDWIKEIWISVAQLVSPKAM